MTDEAQPIFKPYCRFHRAADTLDVYVSNERETSEVISSSLWVYRGLDSGEVIGCRLMGVATLIDGLRELHCGTARVDDILFNVVKRLPAKLMIELMEVDELCGVHNLVITDEGDTDA